MEPDEQGKTRKSGSIKNRFLKRFFLFPFLIFVYKLAKNIFTGIIYLKIFKTHSRSNHRKGEG